MQQFSRGRLGGGAVSESGRDRIEVRLPWGVWKFRRPSGDSIMLVLAGMGVLIAGLGLFLDYVIFPPERKPPPPVAATTTQATALDTPSWSISTPVAPSNPTQTPTLTMDTPTPTPTLPVVRHAGTVTLAGGGFAIDLNAPASMKNWGAHDPVGVSVPDSLKYRGNVWTSLTASDIKATHLDPPAVATKNACFLATTYTDMHVDAVELEDLRDPPRTCLLLSSGRYASVALVRGDEEQVTLKLVVWE